MGITFEKTIEDILALHRKKSADYGVQMDPFANVRASELFGVPPWLGAIIRLNDKIKRIQAFAQNGRLENESLRDSLIDITVYGAIALTLYDENTEIEEVIYKTYEPREVEVTWDITNYDLPTMSREQEEIDSYDYRNEQESERMAPLTCTDYFQAAVGGRTHLCVLEQGHTEMHKDAFEFEWKQEHQSQTVSD